MLVQLKKHSKPRNFVYFAVHVDEICAIKIHFILQSLYQKREKKVVGMKIKG